MWGRNPTIKMSDFDSENGGLIPPAPTTYKCEACQLRIQPYVDPRLCDCPRPIVNIDHVLSLIEGLPLLYDEFNKQLKGKSSPIQ